MFREALASLPHLLIATLHLSELLESVQEPAKIRVFARVDRALGKDFDRAVARSL